MKRRFLPGFLVLCLVFSVFAALPVNAVQPAAMPESVEAHILLENGDRMPRAINQYLDFDEAVPVVRQMLADHQETIHVAFWVENPSEDTGYYKQACRDLVYTAMEHTGVPHQGDYIRRSTYNGYHSSLYQHTSNGKLYIDVTFTISYRTTAQQEAAVDMRVQELLGQLDLSGRTDYQKLCAIYDYMAENIHYDYAGLEDPADLIKYTAYGALMENSSVCQGYATLLYRLCLEAGIDCRVVSGIGNGGGHAWNIVQLEGLYYNADATWDAIWHQDGWEYNYYLRCNATFEKHSRDPEFDTDAFNATYPMSSKDYDPNHIHSFTEQSLTFLQSPADCNMPARYYYTCTCGACGDTAFPYGQALGHTYENGSCIRCSQPDPSVAAKGDVDGNRLVNILDVMAIINCITGNLKLSDAQFAAADLNRDGAVNIFDAMALIGQITG